MDTRIAPGFGAASDVGTETWTLQRIEELINDCVDGGDVDRSGRNQAYARALALLDQSAADTRTARSAGQG
jgi:hypothetical protein